MAPVIEFFLQLVAVERFLVELMTIKESPQMSLRAKRHDGTRDPLFAVFGQNLRRVNFQDFLILLQLDRLQLTEVCCNRREV